MRFSPSTLGWYPTFVAYPSLPGDLVEVAEALYRSLLGKAIEVGADGQPLELSPALPDPVAMLTVVLQRAMDEKAQSYGYDDIKTAITYRGDPNLKFAAEADGFFMWRSAVWTQAYALLAQIQQGLAQFPTQQEAIGMMPKLQIAATG